MDVAGVTEDTHIESEQTLSTLSFGAAIGFGPDADPHRAALLRFDLSSLPTETVVYRAEVELFVRDGLDHEWRRTGLSGHGGARRF